MLNPCCIPLQQGVKVIAGVEMIGSFFIFFLGIVILVGGMDVLKHTGWNFQAAIEAGINDGRILNDQMGLDNPSSILESNPNLFANILGVTFIILGIIFFLFHFMLYKGAKLRNERDCKVWLIISIILWIITLIQFLRGIHFSDPFSEGVGLVLNLYFYWVVWEFRKEILKGGGDTRTGFDSCA